MSNPYIGEIRMFAGNFAPLDWALCNGQLLAISQNEALFNLIGTTYGGDGQNTFGLPDLRGRLPVHQGQGPGLSNYVIGEITGTENVTLTTQQIASHNHTVLGASAASSASPSGSVYAGGQGNINLYVATAPSTPMAAGMVQPNSGGQPHNNLMPFLCVNFIISLFGIFPSQT
jgi:microcystin-dependent protein